MLGEALGAWRQLEIEEERRGKAAWPTALWTAIICESGSPWLSLTNRERGVRESRAGWQGMCRSVAVGRVYWKSAMFVSVFAECLYRATQNSTVPSHLRARALASWLTFINVHCSPFAESMHCSGITWPNKRLSQGLPTWRQNYFRLLITQEVIQWLTDPTWQQSPNTDVFAGNRLLVTESPESSVGAELTKSNFFCEATWRKTYFAGMKAKATEEFGRIDVATRGGDQGQPGALHCLASQLDW